jgi:hypothetical protein
VLKVFIAYRRVDTTPGWAVLIRNELAATLGATVFMDVHDLPYGVDFEVRIRTTVQQCHVALVLIGYDWLEAADEHGNRRLDDPTDFHRLEIVEALRRKRVRVIPVLFGSVRMPDPEQLPDDIQALTRRHAFYWALDQAPNAQLAELIAAVQLGPMSERRSTLTLRPSFNEPSPELSAQVLALCDGVLQAISDQPARRELQRIRRTLLEPVERDHGVFADAARADAALTSLEKLGWQRPALADLPDRVQELRDGGRNMGLIPLTKWYARCASGEVSLPEARLEELRGVLLGSTAAEQLQMPTGAPESELRSVAEQRVFDWRTFEASASASPMEQRVAADVVRFYEDMVALGLSSKTEVNA